MTFRRDAESPQQSNSPPKNHTTRETRGPARVSTSEVKSCHHCDAFSENARPVPDRDPIAAPGFQQHPGEQRSGVVERARDGTISLGSLPFWCGTTAFVG